MSSFQPWMKWSGSKRHHAQTIVGIMGLGFETYVEPFLGGGSVMMQVALGNRTCRLVGNDVNPHLTQCWCDMLQDGPMLTHYGRLWTEMNAKTDEDKHAFFYEIRDRYNRYADYKDFYFLSRQAYNGIVRYNKAGSYNSSYHANRPGITPDKLFDIFEQWRRALNPRCDITTRSYADMDLGSLDADSMVFMDPPYAFSKGLYNGTIDLDTLARTIGGMRCRWALTIDGSRTGIVADFIKSLPAHDSHELTSKSSFKRMKGNDSYSSETLLVGK